MNDETNSYPELRAALAAGPTAGKRHAFYASGSFCIGDDREVHTVEDIGKGLHVEVLGGERIEEDTKFIAACDPGTLSRLLAERDLLAAALESISTADWQKDWMVDQVRDLARRALERAEVIRGPEAIHEHL
jgi:hypothetical protein